MKVRHKKHAGEGVADNAGSSVKTAHTWQLDGCRPVPGSLKSMQFAHKVSAQWAHGLRCVAPRRDDPTDQTLVIVPSVLVVSARSEMVCATNGDCCCCVRVDDEELLEYESAVTGATAAK